MTTTGRPPIGPRIETTLPAETLALVDLYAREAGVSRAWLLRTYIMAGVLQDALTKHDTGIESENATNTTPGGGDT